MSFRPPQGGEIPKTYARQVNVLGISPFGRNDIEENVEFRSIPPSGHWHHKRPFGFPKPGGSLQMFFLPEVYYLTKPWYLVARH